MATLPVNGLRLAYDEAGTGPAVVWVHGSWTDRRGADRLVPLLTARYRVIAYDRRGHSESDRPSAPARVPEHVADLAGLLVHLDAAPAHLLANSFGGVVALTLAVREPDLVASVCAHEPPVAALLAGDAGSDDAPRDSRLLIERVVTEIERGEHEAAARLFMETVLGAGAWDTLPEPSRRTFVANAPTFLQDTEAEAHPVVDPDELARLSAPVLLTSGGRTASWVSGGLDRLAATLPHARRHTFEQVGHIPHLSHPAAYAAVVDAFFDASAARASSRVRRGRAIGSAGP